MNTNESETTMTKHTTTVTDGGTRANCTCGWTSRWVSADGSAHEDAAAHTRRHAKKEA